MLKSIDVVCPFNLNLFLNIREKNQDNEISKLKLINQTVSMCDEIHDIVNIKKSRQGDFSIKVKENDKISKENLNDIYKIANLFFDYVNIKPENYIIDIKRNTKLMGLDLDDSIIAGVLIGLNYYCETNLTKRELLLLSSLVNPLISYFIVGGYNQVIGNNIEKLSKNPFNKYLIIDTSFKLQKDDISHEMGNHAIVLKSSKDNILYNDYLRVLPEELLRIKDFLSKYPDLAHSLSGLSSTYFLAGYDNIPAKVMIDLKKHFPKYKLYQFQNTSGHKILVKYVKNNLD